MKEEISPDGNGLAKPETIRRIREIYESFRDDLLRVVRRADLRDSLKNNPGLLSMIQSPEIFVDGTEKNRWFREVGLLYDRVGPSGRVADFGSFVPVCGLLLKGLGCDVTLVEKLSLYGEGYRPIFEFAQDRGLRFLDVDILSDSVGSQNQGRFDGALCLATIEHLSCGPRRVLSNIFQMVVPGGYLVLDTPNGSMMANRLYFFFKGENLELDFASYEKAEPPYTGHFFCYSPRQVRSSLESAGFQILYFRTLPRKNYDERTIKSRIFEIVIRALAPITRPLRLIENAGPTLWNRDIVSLAQRPHLQG